jgi:hypothetical protein
VVVGHSYERVQFDDDELAVRQKGEVDDVGRGRDRVAQILLIEAADLLCDGLLILHRLAYEAKLVVVRDFGACVVSCRVRCGAVRRMCELSVSKMLFGQWPVSGGYRQ